MPSDFSPALKNLIASGWARSYPALDLTLNTGSQLHYSVVNITVGATSYTQRLSAVGTLKRSLTRPADRCEVTIDNVDGVPGAALVTPNGALTKTLATIKRIYVNNRDASEAYIVTRLTGFLLTNSRAGDQYLKGNVLSDLYAVGNVQTKEVKGSCSWRYKDPDTCTYAGGLPTCDLTLTGPNGCVVHHADLARARFGGHGLFIDEGTLTQFQSLVPDPNIINDPIQGIGPWRQVLRDGTIDGPTDWRMLP